MLTLLLALGAHAGPVTDAELTARVEALVPRGVGVATQGDGLRERLRPLLPDGVPLWDVPIDRDWTKLAKRKLEAGRQCVLFPTSTDDGWVVLTAGDCTVTTPPVATAPAAPAPTPSPGSDAGALAAQLSAHPTPHLVRVDDGAESLAGALPGVRSLASSDWSWARRLAQSGELDCVFTLSGTADRGELTPIGACTGASAERERIQVDALEAGERQGAAGTALLITSGVTAGLGIAALASGLAASAAPSCSIDSGAYVPSPNCSPGRSSPLVGVGAVTIGLSPITAIVGTVLATVGGEHRRRAALLDPVP